MQDTLRIEDVLNDIEQYGIINGLPDLVAQARKSKCVFGIELEANKPPPVRAGGADLTTRNLLH